MSRDLPPRPDLAHLKKQAKALLRELRQRDANASLADALHAVARDYGFASWPKLKAHLQTTSFQLPPLAASSSAPLFPRFTEAAKRTLFFSRYEALSRGCLEIAPEHVLLGVIRGAGGATRGMFESAGISLDDARTAMAVANRPRVEVVEPAQVPLQSSTRALFTIAGEEADRLGHERIATAHIVLALVRDGGAAAGFLRERGLTLDAIRAAASSGGPAEGDDAGD
jgi:hypothetical protein